jgi:hypothetical protein
VALVLPARDHTLSTEWAIYGVTMLSRPVVPVENDPIAGVSRAVRSRRNREQRGRAAVSAAGVQDGQPRLTRWIEASRRNLLKFPGRGFLSIFAVDVKEFRHTWLLARSDRQPYTS